MVSLFASSVHVGEVRRGEREVGGGATQDVDGFLRRGLEIVEGDGSDYEDRHGS